MRKFLVPQLHKVVADKLLLCGQRGNVFRATLLVVSAKDILVDVNTLNSHPEHPFMPPPQQ